MRNFIVKKSAPGLPPPRPNVPNAPTPGGPGAPPGLGGSPGGAPPRPPVPGGGPPGMQPPGAPPGPPRPPGAGPMPPPSGLDDNPLKPRVPGMGMPPGMGEPEPSTDINIDAETGEVTIEKGQTRIKVADLSHSLAEAEEVVYDNDRGFVFAWWGGMGVSIFNLQGGEVGMYNMSGNEYGQVSREDALASMNENVQDGEYVESYLDPDALAQGDLGIEGAEDRYFDQQMRPELRNSPADRDPYFQNMFPGDDEWSEYGNIGSDADMEEHYDEEEEINRLNDLFKNSKKADFTGPEGEYADWLRGVPPKMEEQPDLYTDTHDIPYAAARNRLKPPMFDVKVSVTEGKNARAVAYALQTGTTHQVDVDGQTLTIKDVENPMGLYAEMKRQGFDVEVVGDNLPNIYSGMKVAINRDIPEFGYVAGYPHPVTVLVGQSKAGYVLENNWGRFIAQEGEFHRA